MLFKATFKNISVISWRSVLFVECLFFIQSGRSFSMFL
jgi:hypothetical protein